MRVCHIVVCGLLGSRIFFPHLLTNGTISKKKRVTEPKTCVLIVYTAFVWNIFHSKKNCARYNKKCILVFIEVPIMLVWFLWNLNFLDRFSKNTQISNFKKICPAGAKLLCTDRWVDMTKLIVAFGYFANMPKNDIWHIPTQDLLPQNNWLKHGDISPRLETIWQQKFGVKHTCNEKIHTPISNKQ